MKESKYTAKIPDQKGYVEYSEDENQIWSDLFTRQWDIIQGRACDEYIEGIHNLGLSPKSIPQVPDINAAMEPLTGWRVEPVPALINFDKFFKLLSEKKFPAATFIRTREDFEYLQEPDIFHEIFGHCPLLTNPFYAEFVHEYGKLGLQATKEQRAMLARLYWFTVEFGLIETDKGMRIYGGGILSSIGETVYALESDKPLRKKLEPLDAFRTPYRIDIYQTIYFCIQNFKELFELSKLDLFSLIEQAQTLGMHSPTFPPKQANAN